MVHYVAHNQVLLATLYTAHNKVCVLFQMVSLYSADILEAAVPVKKQRKTPVKKSDPSQDPNMELVLDGKSDFTPIKPKKELSEKQKEALKKGQETRRLKQEAKLAAKEAESAEQKKTAESQAQAELEANAKKEAVKEKRRLARLAKKSASATSSTAGDPEAPAFKCGNEEPVVKVKTQKRKRDPDAPPDWFKSYVTKVKEEEGRQSEVKKPKKEIKAEAAVQAQTQWNDGFVRDRVQNEVDSHMNKMYSMMFGQRH